ncbi:MAG: AMP-binding protein [Gammaproteobacteria bacterium]|nr:AMP-binding protein [Gammaproteobacteria bacterium]
MAHALKDAGIGIGDRVEYIINHGADRLIIVDADVLPLLERLAGRIPSVEKIVVATEDGFENWSTSVADAVEYEDFIVNRPREFEWPEIDEDSPLGLCYTSGTTGNPKGVEYEHRASTCTRWRSAWPTSWRSPPRTRSAASCPCFMPWAGVSPGAP